MQLSSKKIKNAVITSAVAAFFSLTGFFIHMLLKHDKVLGLMDYKITIIMKKVAPEFCDDCPTDVANKK